MGLSSKFDLHNAWPAGDFVSATEFVRHYSEHALKALQRPVYITQHGRTNLALVGVDFMSTLVVGGSGQRILDAQFDTVLDSIATHVIMLDDDFRINRMNTAARRHFQVTETAAQSVPFVSLLSNPVGTYVGDACRRVRDSGDAETFEIDSVRYPGRTLRIQIVPASPGIVVTGEAISQAVQVRRIHAAAAAAASAADITDLLGRGNVNVRGTITSANRTLATLAGSTTEKIMGLRLASLFVQESRDQIRDRIEALLTDGEPFALDVDLLNGSAKHTKVRIGAAVERDGGAISGAAFIVMTRG